MGERFTGGEILESSTVQPVDNKFSMSDLTIRAMMGLERDLFVQQQVVCNGAVHQ